MSIFYRIILVSSGLLFYIFACTLSNDISKNEVSNAVTQIDDFGNTVFSAISNGNVGELISLLPTEEHYVSMYKNSTLLEDEKEEYVLNISELVNSEQIELVNNFSALQKDLKKYEINLEEKKIISINYTIQNISQVINLRLDLIFNEGEDVFWIKLSDCKFIDGKWYLGKDVNLIKQNKPSKNKAENKHVITNKSVGFFRLGDAWQEIALNEYKFEFIQGHGTCVDACCDGGYNLGTNLKKNKSNPYITIGATPFDIKSESATIHKNNPNVFCTNSDNCKGCYYKDKIKYLVIYSDLFKTKEGIGVGSTLQKAQEKFGKIKFEVGWLSEEEFGLKMKVAQYPNIEFVLDRNDYKDNLEDIELSGENNSIRVSDFKSNAKIVAIIVGNKY